ncbi:MAG: hypothetical protein HC836_12605 [Richelia sp. RM2_1_2]|nr:hypothetical protein [Richelia sp. RM2_1_2]
MIEIYYNGSNLFSGLAPVPFIERSNEMIQVGERWAQLENYSFNGNITGQCLTYEEILNKQKEFLNRLSSDFKSFQIYENQQLISEIKFAKITRINFSESNYSQIIPFSLSIESYPEFLFSGSFGILEPEDTIAYQENSDKTLSITHTVSAQGIPTSSNYINSLENARQWVQSRTGANNIIAPAFINACYFSPCLRSVSEEIDRLNGTYSVVTTYESDIQFSGVGILKYTVDVNSGVQDGITTVTVDGEISSCRGTDFSLIRDRYFNFDIYGAAVQKYKSITNLIDLNPIPLVSGVSENQFINVLSFNNIFDNDLAPKVVFRYGTSFNYDYSSDIIEATINGTVVSRGALKTRWESVSGYYQSIDFYKLILPDYYNFARSIAPYLAQYPLNPKPTSSSISMNRFVAEISVQKTWNSRTASLEGFDILNSSISYSPALRQYVSKPVLGGQGTYVVFDLGYDSRANLSISLNGIANDEVNQDDALLKLKNRALVLMAEYLQGKNIILESQSELKNNSSFEKSVGIDAAFSAEQERFSI